MATGWPARSYSWRQVAAGRVGRRDVSRESASWANSQREPSGSSTEARLPRSSSWRVTARPSGSTVAASSPCGPYSTLVREPERVDRRGEPAGRRCTRSARRRRRGCGARRAGRRPGRRCRSCVCPDGVIAAVTRPRSSRSSRAVRAEGVGGADEVAVRVVGEADDDVGRVDDLGEQAVGPGEAGQPALGVEDRRRVPLLALVGVLGDGALLGHDGGDAVEVVVAVGQVGARGRDGADPAAAGVVLVDGRGAVALGEQDRGCPSGRTRWTGAARRRRRRRPGGRASSWSQVFERVPSSSETTVMRPGR